MKSTTVKIEGIVPLLMHRFVMEESDEVKKKDKVYNSVEDAENASYKDEKGYYVPSSQIEGALREASKNFKRGKGTYKETILISVFVSEEKIYLENKYDEIDRRPVVIQRNRVVRSRPKWNKWTLEFTLNYDENRIELDVLMKILEEAGMCKGIGDYHPKFGRFIVKSKSCPVG